MANGDLLYEFWPSTAEDYTADQDEFVSADGSYRRVIAYDTTTAEWAVWSGFLAKAVDIAIIIHYCCTAASGNVKFDAQLEEGGDGSDLTGSGINFGTAQTATDAAPGTANQEEEMTITFTAAQHGLEALDRFRFKLTRDPTVGSDNTGDARILGIKVVDNS